MRSNTLRAVSPSSLLGVSAILALAATGGCAGDEIMNPPLDIDPHRKLVVVPFSDMDFPNGFDSPLGCDLALRVTRVLREKREFPVVGMDRVFALYDKDDPRTLTAKEVAEKTGADYVLMGSVTYWTLADNGTESLPKGVAHLSISIYETAAASREDHEKSEATESDADFVPGQGRWVLKDRSVEAMFPHEYGITDLGGSLSSWTPAQMEVGLRDSTATAISWLVTGHTKDEDDIAHGR